MEARGALSRHAQPHVLSFTIKEALLTLQGRSLQRDRISVCKNAAHNCFPSADSRRGRTTNQDVGVVGGGGGTRAEGLMLHSELDRALMSQL